MNANGSEPVVMTTEEAIVYFQQRKQDDERLIQQMNLYGDPVLFKIIKDGFANDIRWCEDCLAKLNVKNAD